MAHLKGKNRMAKAGNKSSGGPGDKTPKSSLKTKKMTRKEAKSYKKDMKSQGHGGGKMSVRKIRKHGRKASM